MSCSIILKEKGFRLTPQRKLILDIIHRADAHLTAEEIISSVQSRMPGVNKSTIYRTLELLEELNCVFKSELNDKFIYHHVDDGHHHHIICNRCGRKMECKENIFEPVEDMLRKRFGFQAEFKHIIIGGICKECRDKKA